MGEHPPGVQTACFTGEPEFNMDLPSIPLHTLTNVFLASTVLTLIQACRHAQSYSAWSFPEPADSPAPAPAGSAGPSSASIIPTMGNALVLETTDRIPASRACRSKSVLACCVNRTIGTAGAISAMRLAVSIPFMTGI